MNQSTKPSRLTKERNKAQTCKVPSTVTASMRWSFNRWGRVMSVQQNRRYSGKSVQQNRRYSGKKIIMIMRCKPIKKSRSLKTMAPSSLLSISSRSNKDRRGSWARYSHPVYRWMFIITVKIQRFRSTRVTLKLPKHALLCLLSINTDLQNPSLRKITSNKIRTRTYR